MDELSPPPLWNVDPVIFPDLLYDSVGAKFVNERTPQMSSLQSERGRGKPESALFSGSFKDSRSAGLVHTGGQKSQLSVHYLSYTCFTARLFVLGQGQRKAVQF